MNKKLITLIFALVAGTSLLAGKRTPELDFSSWGLGRLTNYMPKNKVEKEALIAALKVHFDKVDAFKVTLAPQESLKETQLEAATELSLLTSPIAQPKPTKSALHSTAKKYNLRSQKKSANFRSPRTLTRIREFNESPSVIQEKRAHWEEIKRNNNL